jgi:hypothetical protein
MALNGWGTSRNTLAEIQVVTDDGVPLEQPTEWIVEDTSGYPVRAERPPSPDAMPRRMPDGPRSERLRRLLEPLLPDWARFESGEDGVDDDITSVTFALPTGRQLRVATQRLRQPIELEFLTLGSDLDVLTRTAAGSQLVKVRHAEPQSSQVILVRPSGFLVNVTLAARTERDASQPEWSNEELAVLVAQLDDDGFETS